MKYCFAFFLLTAVLSWPETVLPFFDFPDIDLPLEVVFLFPTSRGFSLLSVYRFYTVYAYLPVFIYFTNGLKSHEVRPFFWKSIIRLEM